MTAERDGRRRTVRRSTRVVMGFALVAAALFVVNGVSPGWRTPEVGSTAALVDSAPRKHLRVMAFNVAKADFHRGGLDFAAADEVRSRLDTVARSIREEQPDLVCLSEVVMECGPSGIDQVAYLAEACGFAFFASSENYSFGWPFLRIRSGNAILSRLPLRGVGVQQLAGGAPFYAPTNNRRALWCEVELNGDWLLVGSLRNDSFDLVNNARQLEEILAFVGERMALLAGDFNACPDTAPLRPLVDCGRFAPSLDRRCTFPVSGPNRRLDMILGPRDWTVDLESVIDTTASDHLAVTTHFSLP
jgi:endonuclease/exonuclease/phosphatase family metal-dependent hydrolase